MNNKHTKELKKMKRLGKAVLWAAGIIIVIGMINFAPMISRKTPGMKRYSAEGITVYAHPRDAEEVERIASMIAGSRDRIAASLRNADTEGIEVIIYPNRAALKRKTIGLAGLLLPDWYIGKNTSDLVLITSPAQAGPAHTRQSVEQAAVHEYVHVLTDRRHKAMGYWLKEGFALYLAGQEPNTADVRSHRDITYEEFSAPNAVQFAAVGGYSLAYTMMVYLETEYGWDRVLTFLEPGKGFEDVTGGSERNFFEEWKAWLAEI